MYRRRTILPALPAALLLASSLLGPVGAQTAQGPAQTPASPVAAYRPGPAPTPYPLLHAEATIPLPDAANPAAVHLTLFEGRLYAANRETGILSVIDLRSNTVFASISGLRSCREFVGIPGRNVGFVTLGGENNVGIINLKNATLSAKIAVGGEPDAIAYDEASGLIYVACVQSRSASLIDTKSHRVIGRIPLGGKPGFVRQSTWNGMLYQYLENARQFAVIDLKRRNVVACVNVKKEVGPTALEYYPPKQSALRQSTFSIAALEEGIPVLLALEGGAISPFQGNVDAAIWGSMIFTTTRAGTLQAVGADDADGFDVYGETRTTTGSHSLAVDISGRLYVLGRGILTVYAYYMPHRGPTQGATFTPPVTPSLPNNLKDAVLDTAVKIRVFFRWNETMDVKVIQSSGYPELDEACLKTLRNLKFNHAMENGLPIDDTHDFVFTFRHKG